jgi:hypothetical protein
MARVVQIPRKEAPAEAPLFSREQAHIVGAEKLASFRRGKAWGVAIGVASTLLASMVLLAFYAALDASSDASAITGAAVAQRADAVSAEMQFWLKE